MGLFWAHSADFSPRRGDPGAAKPASVVSLKSWVIWRRLLKSEKSLSVSRLHSLGITKSALAQPVISTQRRLNVMTAGVLPPRPIALASKRTRPFGSSTLLMSVQVCPGF
jgi:hypothetical protein